MRLHQWNIHKTNPIRRSTLRGPHSFSMLRIVLCCRYLSGGKRNWRRRENFESWATPLLFPPPSTRPPSSSSWPCAPFGWSIFNMIKWTGEREEEREREAIIYSKQKIGSWLKASLVGSAHNSFFFPLVSPSSCWDTHTHARAHPHTHITHIHTHTHTPFL